MDGATPDSSVRWGALLATLLVLLMAPASLFVAQWYPFPFFGGSRFLHYKVTNPKKGALTITWLLGYEGLMFSDGWSSLPPSLFQRRSSATGTSAVKLHTQPPGSNDSQAPTTCADVPKSFLQELRCPDQPNFSVPGEVRDVPGIDGNFHTSDFLADREKVINTCLGHRRNLSKRWPDHFGNAWFLWAEEFTDRSVCGPSRFAAASLDRKFLRLPYCADSDLRENRSQRDLCRRWTHARNFDGQLPTCVWYSFGFNIALAELQEEWIRGTYFALKSHGLEQEPACSHVETLPVGAVFAAIHMRCGDIARKGGFSRHYMLDPAWLRNFLPVVTCQPSATLSPCLLGQGFLESSQPTKGYPYCSMLAGLPR